MSLQIIYDEIKKMDRKLNSIEDKLAKLTEVLQEVKRKK